MVTSAAATRIQRWRRRVSTGPGLADLLNEREEGFEKGTVSRGGKSVTCPVSLAAIPLRNAFYNMVEGKVVVYDSRSLANSMCVSLSEHCPLTRTVLTAPIVRRLIKNVERQGDSELGARVESTLNNLDELRALEREERGLVQGVSGICQDQFGRIMDKITDGEEHADGEIIRMLYDWREDVLQFARRFPAKCIEMLKSTTFSDARVLRHDRRNIINRILVGFVADTLDIVTDISLNVRRANESVVQAVRFLHHTPIGQIFNNIMFGAPFISFTIR